MACCIRVGYSGDQPLKVGDEVTEGERVRTGGGSHAMLRLRDGSLVEMNERAEFGVSMGRKDTTVQLERGNIIIQAAKRASGHLYVDFAGLPRIGHGNGVFRECRHERFARLSD